MSIEIIPPGSSAVVTDRHGNYDRDRNRDRDCDNKDVELMKAIKGAEADLERSGGYHYAGTLENIKDAEAQLERSLGDKFSSNSRDIKDAEVRITRDVKDVGSESVIATNVVGASGVLATKDARHDGVLATTTTGSAGVLATKDSRFDVMQGMHAGFTASALASCHSDEKNQDYFFSGQKQVSDSATATLSGFKDLTALNYQIEGRSLLEAAKNTNFIAVQAEKNTNDLKVQAQTFAAASQLESQKNAAAQALLSHQLASEAARQAAECCCELKEKIGAEGQATRDLINSVNSQNLRDRAIRSENALAAYFAAKAAPSAPVI